MRILFASPDRDLLECYKKLLETDSCEIVTAFDGTQVLSLLSNESFDISILDETIPRIEFKTLIARMRDIKLPVIGLINEPVRVHRLTSYPTANAYLSYPFCAEDITQIIKDTADKVGSGEKLIISGIEISVPDFRITGGAYLTSGEIDVLKSLMNGDTVTDEYGAYISSLNAKFTESGAVTVIKYRTKKGFELVNRNE